MNFYDELYMCGCMQRPEVNLRCLPSLLNEFLIGLRPVNLAQFSWPGEPQLLAYLYFSYAEIMNVCPNPKFFNVDSQSNLGLSVANTYPSKLSPQAPLLFSFFLKDGIPRTLQILPPHPREDCDKLYPKGFMLLAACFQSRFL